MKRNETRLEEILRLPPGSREEMKRALDRVRERLQSNAAVADVKYSLMEQEAIPCRIPRENWARMAILTAAAFLIAAVLVGVVWRSRVYGILQTADGRSHRIYAETAFGSGGGVLTLRDESRVEIRPMSDVSLQRAADGVRVLLGKGMIIVNAAEQRKGHLYVQTKDMTVSVVGTVFVVNAEEAGSRVAVLQGEVQVQQGATGKQVRSGEQVATSPSMKLLPVKEDVSWSRHAVEHLALLDPTRTPDTRATRRPSPEPGWQKAAGSRMSFEAADVRPSDSRDPGFFPLSIDNIYRSTGGVFKASFPLRHYIEFAYKLSLTPGQRESWLSRVPKWVETEPFAIDAKAPTNNPTKDQMRLMVQSLLADRFKLALHFEPKQVPVLALALVKPGILGPQIRSHTEGPPCPAKREESDLFPTDIDPNVWPYHCETAILIRPGVTPARLGPEVKKVSVHNQLVAGRNVSLEIMLDSFMRLGIGMGNPVVDRTGLTGNYDFSLEWTPEPDTTARPAEFTAITLAEALKEQLGMKLESIRASVPFLVIDHVEKPSEN
jgi:uncharacterized protein (TIGR03435 family)